MAQTSKKSKSSAKKNTVKQSFFKKEILSICTIALGVYFIVSVWFGSGGVFGNILDSFLKGLFGDVTYILPLCVIATAVYVLAAKTDKIVLKSSVLAALPLLFSMFLQWCYVLAEKPETVKILDMYSKGIRGIGGGFFGAALATPIISILGLVGCFIVMLVLFLIAVVIVFEISVTHFFGQVGSGIALFVKNSREEHLAAKAEKQELANQYAAEKKAMKNIPENIAPSSDVHISETELEDYNWASNDLVINDVLGNEFSNTANDAPDDAADDEPPFEPAPVHTDETEKNDPVYDENGEIVPLEIEEPPIHKEYIHPTPDLLYEGPKVHTGGKLDELKANAQRLVEIFDSFGIETRVTNITRGSSITRYEVVPAAGIKVNKITALDQDIALRLPANNVRIEVLPGYIGVEVSNDSVSTVYMRGLIDTPEFKSHESKLAVAVGKDINGSTVVMDIAKTPHLLIAGATGSGKSVCINTIITSILYKASPDEVKLVMVDPKVVELGMYNGIPHLLVPIVTDPRKAAGALCWAVQEMEDRYQKFADKMVRDLKGYNAKIAAEDPETRPLPQIVIIIDELADLMMVAPGEVQDYICRLAQKARAAGMHLVLATQRPSVDVITGLIKANIPSRISFAVSSAIDSRTILDHGGAEKLMGKGDMLMMIAGMSKLTRVQGAFISDTDVENVVNFVKSQTTAEYNNDILKTIETGAAGDNSSSSDDHAAEDELFESAAEIAFELGQVSASMLQRRLKVGYARAGRLLDLLDKRNVISSYDGSNKPRTLLMSKHEFNIMMGKYDDNEQQ